MAPTISAKTISALLRKNTAWKAFGKDGPGFVCGSYSEKPGVAVRFHFPVERRGFRTHGYGASMEEAPEFFADAERVMVAAGYAVTRHPYALEVRNA